MTLNYQNNNQILVLGSVWNRDTDFTHLGPNRTFPFQTVGTKPNVPISDSWDQTKRKVPISDSWDQTQQKSSDFRCSVLSQLSEIGTISVFEPNTEWRKSEPFENPNTKKFRFWKFTVCSNTELVWYLDVHCTWKINWVKYRNRFVLFHDMTKKNYFTLLLYFALHNF